MNIIKTQANHQSNPVYLNDYRIPDYLIDKTHLCIDLQDDITLVSASLQIRRNPQADPECRALVLQGIELELRKLILNGKAVGESDYEVNGESLTIYNVPASFTLDCETEIKPQMNTALVGLYQSKGVYSTHCEPQGFRRITYYLDRPDVMSEFTTTLVADKDQFPVLLSNGNLVDQGVIDSQPHRHWATWHDPFKKPAYLFAMVAGDFEFIEDAFTTCSGREVVLRLFADRKNLSKCHHAMQTLKQAMRWDEEVYGREYDLDIFMFAVIADFNFGAMENKGLNLYRADCLLVDPQTTTDADIQYIEEVVAHEYFHNWSGNRVTCRDWFQLSLKEGFTTYRGFQFCADRGSAAVKRIEEVNFIRSMQFAEDASPLAHPIRPEAYRAIWNFYTSTVYQKGAEVIRMLATLLGPERFRRGTDLFFQRHDGQAVTTEEFIAAMESVSSRELSQFKRWYSQAGTPKVAFSGKYNAERKQFALTVKQTCSATAECQHKKPFHIPLTLSLLGHESALPLTLQAAGDEGNQPASRQMQARDQAEIMLEVTEPEQTFIFEQVKERPVPSLFRDFSAPVKWSYDYSLEDLALIMRLDSNGFCRWEASQILWTDIIHRTLRDQSLGRETEIPTDIIALYRSILQDVQSNAQSDQGLIAHLLMLPSELYLSGLAESIDVVAIHNARRAVKRQLAMALKDLFQQIYGCYQLEESVSIAPAAMAGRALRNCALAYLVETHDPKWIENGYQQLLSANNMTDAVAALTCLVNSGANSAENFKQQALAAFYDKWQHESLVINQWLAVQARSPLPGTLSTVQALVEHPAFEIKSPNQVRSLIGEFCNHNPINFHHEGGGGYRFLVDQVIVLNGINPQMASRTLARSPLINWKRYGKQQQDLMQSQLQRLGELSGLSREVFEVVDKCLQS